MAKRTCGDPPPQDGSDSRSGKWLFSILKKKIDGLSQSLNVFLDVGIAQAIERKTSRIEILSTLKYTLTAKVGSQGTPKR